MSGMLDLSNWKFPNPFNPKKKKAATPAPVAADGSGVRPPSHPDLAQYLSDMTPASVQQATAPSDLDQLIAMIQSSVNAGGAAGGGFDPTPYDTAAAGAKTAAAQGSGAITQAYADLQGKLAAGNTDLATQMAAQRGNIVANGQASSDQLKAMVADQANKLKLQGVDTPSLTNGYDAEMQARATGNDAQNNARLALADRLSQVAAQSGADRQSDAQLSQAEALGTTQNNLAQMLSQIGLQKSQAQMAAEKQAATQGLTPLDAAMKIFSLKQQQQSSDVDQLKQQAALADKLSTTPKQDFEASYPDLVQANPDVADVFETLIGDVSGSGPMAMSKAQRALSDQQQALTSGKNPFGKKFSPAQLQMLNSWVADYYDDKTKRLNSAAQAQLAGQ